jgi:hypothetical protein
MLYNYYTTGANRVMLLSLRNFRGKYTPWSRTRPKTTRDAVRRAVREDRDSKIIVLHSYFLTGTTSKVRTLITTDCLLRLPENTFKFYTMALQKRLTGTM